MVILPGLKILIEQAPNGSARRYNAGKSNIRLKNLRKLLLLYSLRKLFPSDILSYAKEATYFQICETDLINNQHTCEVLNNIYFITESKK